MNALLTTATSQMKPSFLDVVHFLKSFDDAKIDEMPKAKKACIPALRFIWAASKELIL